MENQGSLFLKQAIDTAVRRLRPFVDFDKLQDSSALAPSKLFFFQSRRTLSLPASVAEESSVT